MTTFEHKELKGITIKNIVVTIISTASIVVSVMTTCFQLKTEIREVRSQQDTQNRVNDIRIKVLEGQLAVLQHDVDQLKSDKSTRPDHQ